MNICILVSLIIHNLWLDYKGAAGYTNKRGPKY